MTLESILQSILDTPSLDDAWRAACEALRAITAADAIVYTRYATASNGTVVRENPTILANGFETRWESHYIAEGLHAVDPVHEHAMTEQRPFYWNQLARREHLSAAHRHYFDAARDAGLADGLTIPVFGPHLSIGYVSLSLRDAPVPLETATVISARTVAQSLHIRFGEIELAQEPVILSTREREALVWAARGKSNTDIADILGISRHTVDTLLRRVFDKLGVNDRTTAAIKGLSTGVLRKS